jgi:hypothetical protein
VLLLVHHGYSPRDGVGAARGPRLVFIIAARSTAATNVGVLEPA